MNIQFKGIKFLIFVTILYLVLFIFDSQNIQLALQSSLATLYKMLPIFIFIIFLTAIVNYFLKPKEVIKHFGKDSGIKGIVYSLLGGVLSHGPTYVWYGILNDMRKDGVKDSLLIIFLYARAVKLPLLPFMLDLLGVIFTITMTLYTLLFALLQGLLFQKIQKDSDA